MFKGQEWMERVQATNTMTNHDEKARVGGVSDRVEGIEVSSSWLRNAPARHALPRVNPSVGCGG